MGLFLNLTGCLQKQKRSKLALSLQDMPDAILTQISINLDLPSVLNLRKVSHRFRDFLDEFKSSSFLTGISLNVKSDMISLEILFPVKSESLITTQRFHILYEKDESGCIVQWCKKEQLIKKSLEGQDFVDIAIKDFQILMMHQESILKELRLQFEYHRSEMSRVQVGQETRPAVEIILSKIKGILNLRQKMQVEELTISASQQHQILEILSFVDSKTLRKITLDGRKSFPIGCLEIDELEKLEQWKNAKEIRIIEHNIRIPMERFSLFQKVELHFETFSVDDLLKLKEVFLNSFRLESFILSFNFIEDTQLLFDSLGEPSEEVYQLAVHEKRWTFKHSPYIKVYTKKLAVLMYSDHWLIKFERVEEH